MLDLEAVGLIHRTAAGEVRPNNPRLAVERWVGHEEARIRQVRDSGEQWEIVFRSLEG